LLPLIKSTVKNKSVGAENLLTALRAGFFPYDQLAAQFAKTFSCSRYAWQQEKQSAEIASKK